MLNPFPIQFLTLFAFFILRCFIGAILVFLGFQHWRFRHELRYVFRLSWWPFGWLSTALLISAEFVLAALTVVGAFTQYAMIALALMALKFVLIRPLIDHHSIPPRLFYLLLLGCALTLFITGAGVPAFDLPL